MPQKPKRQNKMPAHQAGPTKQPTLKNRTYKKQITTQFPTSRAKKKQITNPFPIARAKHADFEKIISLANALFGFPKLKWDSKNIYFVCYVKGKALSGFSHLILRNDDAILQGVGVKPEFRGKGLGSMLVSKACDYAIENGRTTILLKVKSGNFKALGLYLKKGFIQSKIGSTIVMCFRPNN